MFKFVLVSCLVGIALAAPPNHHRIVNGEDIDITQVPYQVAIGNRASIWCGGSIIAKRFIVTAAHCFNEHNTENEAFMVFAGMSSLNHITSDMLKPVKTVTVHPGYDQESHNRDIAVLELIKDLVYNNEIQPVGLPLQGAAIPTGDFAYASGWGKLSENGQSARQLQGVELELFDNASCHKISNFDKTSMLCAGSMDGTVDTCQGDSGGPLVANGMLYGVTSFGIGCATPGYPGVYANVASFRHFIDGIAGTNQN